MDESGHEQLAVTAEERETRDGHYTYKAEGPLAQIRPLSASNMAMVTEWLDQARCLLVPSPILAFAQLYLPPPLSHPPLINNPLQPAKDKRQYIVLSCWQGLTPDPNPVLPVCR